MNVFPVQNSLTSDERNLWKLFCKCFKIVNIRSSIVLWSVLFQPCWRLEVPWHLHETLCTRKNKDSKWSKCLWLHLLEYYSPLLGVEISKQKEYLTEGLFEYQDSPLKMVIEFSFPQASCQDQVELPFHKHPQGPHHVGQQEHQHLHQLWQEDVTGLPLHLWVAPERNPHVSQDD